MEAKAKPKLMQNRVGAKRVRLVFWTTLKRAFFLVRARQLGTLERRPDRRHPKAKRLRRHARQVGTLERRPDPQCYIQSLRLEQTQPPTLVDGVSLTDSKKAPVPRRGGY